MSDLSLSVAIPSEFVREVAVQLADVLVERGIIGAVTVSPYLTTAEAADYLRASKQRVHDLTSQGRLRACKDGSRNLYRRDDLDAYLAGVPGA